MKKDIMKIVETEGTFRLNKISKLRRWQKDIIYDEKVDEFEIDFDSINGIYIGYSKKIVSRDYEGIIEECKEATKEYFERASEQFTKALSAGYRM